MSNNFEKVLSEVLLEGKDPKVGEVRVNKLSGSDILKYIAVINQSGDSSLSILSASFDPNTKEIDEFGISGVHKENSNLVHSLAVPLKKVPKEIQNYFKKMGVLKKLK